ncbi:hypothetical protein ACSBR2_020925 [Camellia fascicularis]
MSQVIETTGGTSTRISSGVRLSRMTSVDVEDTAGLTASEKQISIEAKLGKKPLASSLAGCPPGCPNKNFGSGFDMWKNCSFLHRAQFCFAKKGSFMYGVRKPVQNCIWLGMVLIAWHYLFDKRVERETNIKFPLFVNKVLVCFLVGALLWLVKTLVVKVLTSSFHESLFNQFVIETLSGPPLIEIKNIQDDEERTMAEVWKLQKPQRTSSQKFSRSSSKKQGEGILIDHLHKLIPKNISAWNMKRLIKIVHHGVLSTLDEQILESTNGDESTTERRALSLTLNDTKTAINKLHQMVNVLVGIITAVVCLLILGIATIFEAIIFLFVMHPFDVGDRCEIDVEEMNILTIVFLRFDNQKIIYPNSTLSIKPISNYYRSPDMGNTIELCVHIATPIEKIAIIRQRIISYIESKKDHWYPSPIVVPMNLEELNKLKISVWLRHRMNHQDMHEIVALNLILNTACFPLTSTFATCPL